MIKHNWNSKVVVSIAKVKQFFTAFGPFKKVESIVAGQDNENTDGRGAADKAVMEEADETVVKEGTADMMEELADTYGGEFEVIANENTMTKKEALASNITQTLGTSRGEEDVDESTNE